ncbi:MAG: class I SAM-dependent methyltransferase [Planctomycetes bacterium]|nr:class I SAM-dependent methyltransferase [Planctomycetota bacterium]
MSPRLASYFLPRSEELLQIGRAIYAERADLREAYPDPTGVPFAKWLAVNGPLEYPERLGRFFPPLPPDELRRTSSGGEGLHGFLYTGAEDWHIVLDLWDIYAERELDSIHAVLDFGCGIGRLLRWARAGLPNAKLRGCDVRRAQIAWCREHLDAQTFVNRAQPPLDEPDRSADLTLALSLFSHFDAASNRAWMNELARITRRDGLILATTHGPYALAVLTRSYDHQRALGMSDADGRAALRELPAAGHLFRPLPESPLTDATDLESSYGNAFFTERWAAENWGSCVEIVGMIPARFWFLQDVYVLRPR